MAGFTLVEILVTISILGSLAFVLLINVYSGKERIEQRGVAETVLAELDAARTLAAEQQAVVAFAFNREDAQQLLIFAGEDRLQPLRTARVASGDSGCVLWAAWPGLTAVSTPASGPLDLAPLKGKHYILFHPDGRIESDGPWQDDRLLLTTCARYTGKENDSGWLELTSVDSPKVIAIEKSGSITVLESTPAELAQLPLSSRSLNGTDSYVSRSSGDNPPEIVSVDVSPSDGRQGDTVGMGRSYVEIHPVLSGARVKRFGTMSLTVKAKDADGGPLFLNCTCTPSEGAPGSFANVDFVRMELDHGLWKGVLSWTPPPESQTGQTYDFTATVEDPGGLRSAVSDASKLSVKLKVLEDLRLVIETQEGVLYLCNMEGGESVRLTPEDAKESEPFWVADGTAIFCIARREGATQLVRYSADGADREVVVDLPQDVGSLRVDPFGFYLAYSGDARVVEVPDPGGGDNPPAEVTVYTVFARHTEWRGESTKANEYSDGTVNWNPIQPGTLQFNAWSFPSENQDINAFQQAECVTLTGVEAKVAATYTTPLFKLDGAAYNPKFPDKFAIVEKGTGSKKDSEEKAKDKLYLYETQNNFRNRKLRRLMLGHKLKGPLNPYLYLFGPYFGLGLTGSQDSLSWSNNGLHLAVAEDDPKGELLLVSFPSGNLDSEVKVEAAFKGLEHKSHFKPSPNGEQIYYIDEQKGATMARVMRCPVGKSPLPVAAQIVGVKSFALSN